jgi:DNA helicase IV
MPTTTSAFDLPTALAHKAAHDLVGRDEQHFTTLATCLQDTLADLSARLDAVRRAPAGQGQQALDRDLEVHRLTARLRTLRRFGLDLCLGRMVALDDPEPVYVGRLGLTDAAGRRLLVDWRSPAAEPFFGATHATPMGLASRRRYRWTRGRITDYWDEVFTPEGLTSTAALDDQSAFLASLGADRSPRMRDVLATIQADQDAIVRADAHGALVVDGGPGTGKTVVALHRSAYLLHADPRLGPGRGRVLFVGPHEPYLAYVADVLPGLGEEGVQTCTLRDLVAEGAGAPPERDPEVAGLKASATLVGAVEAAVRFYEEPPSTGITVRTPWRDLRLEPDDWAEAFEAVEPGTPHDEAQERVWEEVLTILADQLGGDVPEALLREALQQDEELRRTVSRAWPLLDAADVVADLWSVPAYLRRCAPELTAEQVRLLQRREARAWTTSDLPFLDAARHRVGDPRAARRRRRQEAAAAAEREHLVAVVDDLLAADHDGEGRMTMFLAEDGQHALTALAEQEAGDAAAPARTGPDALGGPYAHVVVDEAQELTDAEWQMVLRRCPSQSLTVVGDRAQARGGFPESWPERLGRVGVRRVALSSLRTNYRTPQEVMAHAEPVIRAALPDANVPVSVRSTGLPVVHGTVADLTAVLEAWLAEHAGGIACVVGARSPVDSPRVRSLAPELTKGLEFDLVVLVDPESYGTGTRGAVDRYVAMTRATSQLVVLTP